ncbi:hypothetical protein HOD38_04520 [archaeon]|nr:hypothetical protein [archaeon]MBT4397506.1 hypothetical protein [archaeon]MBT4440862.1 hypothetical protein [archaeon]
MSDLRDLVEGYVDGEKRREIEDCLESKEVEDLMDVNSQMQGLGALLGLKGVDKRRVKELRIKLYGLGFLQELSVKKVVDQIVTPGLKGNLPYFDSEIVGDDVERNRQLVLESDEFGEAICRKYGSLSEVITDFKIGEFLQVNWGKPLELRKALFQLNLLTEIDIDDVFSTLDRSGPINSYLREDVVGDMAEVYREVVLRSKEFRELVEDRFDSMYDISGNINRKFYALFGIERSRRSELKAELFRRGFLTEVPIERIVDTLRKRGHISPYLDPEIVGDKVEEHREIVLGSDYFRNYLYTNFSNLGATYRSGSIATLLGFKKGSNEVRTELVRRGFYE